MMDARTDNVSNSGRTMYCLQDCCPSYLPQVCRPKEPDPPPPWQEVQCLHAGGSHPGRDVTSSPQVPRLPEDVHNDKCGDEVSQGQQRQGDEDGPEEVGRTLLLHLGSSWCLRISGHVLASYLDDGHLLL